MRITTVLLIIVIIFASGLFSGLMYNTAGDDEGKTEQQEQVEQIEESTVEQQIEAELQELNEFPHDGERELAQLEHVVDHPVQKVAGTFEKGTTYFFEKVVGVLYSLSELAF